MNELNRIVEASHKAISECNQLKNFVWTPTARRTALLVAQAYKFNEPFLLVGETGIGKTTVCQILAHINKKSLHIMNCHMHSEAADFLGSIRPVRTNSNVSNGNQLFEWQDGPLIWAMREGQDFLIDEISLADDSVLERLNSVLEDDRSLLVAENVNSDESALITAHSNFRIFATMNPGGDFGKKELSAALRNRFTEIWCPMPSLESQEFEIICHQQLNCTDSTLKMICVEIITKFLKWLKIQPFFSKKSLSAGTISIRDLVRWVDFMNKFSHSSSDSQTLLLGLMHGASLVFIDALNIDESNSVNPSNQCIEYILEMAQNLIDTKLNGKHKFNMKEVFNSNLCQIENESSKFKCGPFEICKGSEPAKKQTKYCLNSKSTKENIQRILRCLLMDNPVMLEGSPGVGKTSIIETLGAVTRNKVVRINLSEQTDLSELFGADLPSVNELNQEKQQFTWMDGPFLLALKQGHWIILDEINLASQSVLEGLNSCFDHRGEIFISELNRKFLINKSQTKIFACQNPYLQGGGRKGLPKSFLNRFSKVYINKMSSSDLLEILTSVYGISTDILTKMIAFNEQLNDQV